MAEPTLEESLAKVRDELAEVTRQARALRDRRRHLIRRATAAGWNQETVGRALSVSAAYVRLVLRGVR